MDTTPASKPLLEQLPNALRLKHYSFGTGTAYIHWVKRFVLVHHKRHPVSMDTSEITAFLTNLASTMALAARCRPRQTAQTPARWPDQS